MVYSQSVAGRIWTTFTANDYYKYLKLCAFQLKESCHFSFWCPGKEVVSNWTRTLGGRTSGSFPNTWDQWEDRCWWRRDSSCVLPKESLLTEGYLTHELPPLQLFKTQIGNPFGFSRKNMEILQHHILLGLSLMYRMDCGPTQETSTLTLWHS